MDKTRLTLRETYVSQTEGERQQMIQRALDQHLYHLLTNGAFCYTTASDQPRLREEVQIK